jgi:ABC-type antimicrobial peptide transport system permease subunit
MSRIVEWFKGLHRHFIDDCKSWYKLWSSWLAILWGLIVTVFWNDPTILGQLAAVLPTELRAALSPFILAFVAGLPIIVARLKQRKLDAAAAKLKEAQNAARQQQQ